jgi:murein DD-endopeptidase MepM/ murein hydrolase activator NlpD
MNYEAVQKEIQKLIAAAAAAQQTLTFSSFICPLKTYTRISDEYGYRTNPVSGVYKLHGGIDFAAPKGTPIYAAASGYVTVAGWNSSGYGNYVILYHGTMSDGVAYSTLYAHMSSIAVQLNTTVAQGQIIGYVGSTGNSTGNHLHLEVWQGRSSASRVDPRKYIPISHS